MTFIVGFNGPPQCGKDTMAKLFLQHMDAQGVMIPVMTKPLSWPLRLMAHVMIGRTYQTVDYERFKEEYFESFKCTGRQLMINCSECFLKPTYGLGALSKMFIESIEESFPMLVVIPDSGFQCEIEPLCEHYGAENVYMVRIHREGCTFENDSREYVTHPLPTHNMDVTNDGTIKDLATEAGRLYGRLVNQRGWQL